MTQKKVAVKTVKKKIIRDVKSFTVVRKKWLRGKGSMASALLWNGKSCCLGFYSEACGISRKVMHSIATPADLAAVSEQKSNVIWKTKLVRSGVNSISCQKLININDSSTTDDAFKEKKLTSLFKRLGIKVKFQ